MEGLKTIFSEKAVVWFTAVVCIFHSVLSLVHYFLTVSNLYPLDYALILISLTAWIIHLVIYSKKPRLGKEFLLLAAIFLWYLLSCQVMTDTYGRDWFSYNKDPLFDTLLLFALIFPLGTYFAKEGCDTFILILIHALVFVWTGFMAYVIIRVFQNRIIVTPTGGQIGMSSDIALCLNTHYNTTGVIELVMVIITLFFLFTDRRPITLRIAYGIACLINLVALVLSNSRTAFIAAAIFFAASVFSSVYNGKWDMSLRKKILIGIGAAAITLVLMFLFRSLVFSVHENTTHLKALLSANADTASSTSDSAATSSARDMTSMETMYGRVNIWQYALRAMVVDAKRFIFGVTPVSVISAITEVSGGELNNYYTHNQLFEVGLSLGIPGMILFILFIAYLAINSYRITIRQNEGQKAWLAVSIVVTLLIANLTEATLMFYRFFSSYPFFLFCGWVCGAAGQLTEKAKFSGKRRNRKKV